LATKNNKSNCLHHQQPHYCFWFWQHDKAASCCLTSGQTGIFDDILKLHDVNGSFTIKYMNRNGLYNPCLRGWTVPSAVWDYLMSGFMEDQHVPIEQKLVYAIL